LNGQCSSGLDQVSRPASGARRGGCPRSPFATQRLRTRTPIPATGTLDDRRLLPLRRGSLAHGWGSGVRHRLQLHHLPPLRRLMGLRLRRRTHRGLRPDADLFLGPEKPSIPLLPHLRLRGLLVAAEGARGRPPAHGGSTCGWPSRARSAPSPSSTSTGSTPGRTCQATVAASRTCGSEPRASKTSPREREGPAAEGERVRGYGLSDYPETQQPRRERRSPTIWRTPLSPPPQRCTLRAPPSPGRSLGPSGRCGPPGWRPGLRRSDREARGLRVRRR
jgi:hypothetical protein